MDLFCLVANDVDVYHGSFTSDINSSMTVLLDQIKYQEVDGFGWEINTVKCERLSTSNFLSNNDLNITGSCFHVNLADDQLFSVHASPSFWEFVFQENSKRVIKTVKPFNNGEYGGKTCVRIAFKAFEMQDFGFSFGDIEPTVGTLANSHKEKFDKMKSWADSPLHEYQCNKRVNHYVMAKKHEKMKC